MVGEDFLRWSLAGARGLAQLADQEVLAGPGVS
jgi:hypothetical protein